LREESLERVRDGAPSAAKETAQPRGKELNRYIILRML